MQILDNIIILLLPIIAFIAGKRISDRYNANQISELQYQLRLAAAEKGIAYVAPPSAKKYMPIGQNFMDRLKQQGRAVQKLSTDSTSR